RPAIPARRSSRMNSRDHRRPAAFRLDDPHVVVTSPDEAPARPSGRATVLVTPEPEAAALPALLEQPAMRRRGPPWGKLFWSALAGLVALGFCLAVASLIEAAFARSDVLGFFSLALTLVAAVALAALIVREIAGLIRLNPVERLRAQAEGAIASDDREAARAVVRDLLAVEKAEPRLARARSQMQAHLGEIIDGADLMRLAERELMAPLDQDARRLVAGAAK